MHQYYVPLTTNNEMSVAEVVRECHSENWAPVIVMKIEDRTIVPFFKQHDTAMKFIFRNFGKKVRPTSGTIGLNEEHFEIFTNKGWEIEIWDFPRKIATLEIGIVEIPEGFQMPNQGVWT